MLLLIVSLLLHCSLVASHGVMVNPPPKYIEYPQFPGKVKGYASPIASPPAKLLDQYSSLREMFIQNIGYCINTDEKHKVKRSEFNDDEFQFRGQDEDGIMYGFVHPGPCEIWVNQKMVYSHENCRDEFKYPPTKMKMNFENCGKECVVEFYHVAIHFAKTRGLLEPYNACVTVVNDKADSNNSAAAAPTDPAAQEQPVQEPAKPANNTDKPTKPNDGAGNSGNDGGKYPSQEPAKPAGEASTAEKPAGMAVPSPTPNCRRRHRR